MANVTFVLKIIKNQCLCALITKSSVAFPLRKALSAIVADAGCGMHEFNDLMNGNHRGPAVFLQCC